jgi:hypothetical protein
MQFLSDGKKIRVGSVPKESVVVERKPRTWRVSVSINDNAVRDAKADRDEIANREDIEEVIPSNRTAPFSSVKAAPFRPAGGSARTGGAARRAVKKNAESGWAESSGLTRGGRGDVVESFKADEPVARGWDHRRRRCVRVAESLARMVRVLGRSS